MRLAKKAVVLYDNIIREGSNMAKEPWTKKYTECFKLLGLFMGIYIVFLFADAIVGHPVPSLSALYCFLLFPVCGIAYAILSYRKTSRVCIPHLIYLFGTLAGMLILLLLTGLFATVAIDASITAKRICRLMERTFYVCLLSTISTVASWLISLTTALIVKLSNRGNDE